MFNDLAGVSDALANTKTIFTKFYSDYKALASDFDTKETDLIKNLKDVVSGKNYLYLATLLGNIETDIAALQKS